MRNRGCTAKTRGDPGQAIVGPGLATVAVRLGGHLVETARQEASQPHWSRLSWGLSHGERVAS